MMDEVVIVNLDEMKEWSSLPPLSHVCLITEVMVFMLLRYMFDRSVC